MSENNFRVRAVGVSAHTGGTLGKTDAGKSRFRLAAGSGGRGWPEGTHSTSDSQACVLLPNSMPGGEGVARGWSACLARARSWARSPAPPLRINKNLISSPLQKRINVVIYIGILRLLCVY